MHLTPTEFDLLVSLVETTGRVLTRERLLAEVWGYRDGSGARTVDSHVRALRRKLGDGVVRTVHGVGYALGGSDAERRRTGRTRADRGQPAASASIDQGQAEHRDRRGGGHDAGGQRDRDAAQLPGRACAGSAAIIALLMVQPVSRGMTSPLRRMERAASAMAKGDLDERVPVSSQDEVGRLAVAFNQMADELAEVDRQRRDLVANVSHELRTPISALRATLENLDDGVVQPDPPLIATMLAQTERLQRLVGQLLDLSRLESGATPLHLLRFPVADLLEAVADEGALHAPSVTFTVDVEPAMLALDGDPERLHQVIANLTDNAARFTPEGGEIVLRARRDGEVVRLEVLDEGPGIPPEVMSRVFERFYRTDDSRSRDEGGSGLGLAIARWVVDLHGGRIRAEAREPHGCRMVVELPDGGDA